MPLSIAIIGAGPGGLALARYLQVKAIPFTVFERDASRTARAKQGGTLNLNPDSGSLVIKEVGLWDEFLKHARKEGETMRVLDKDGKVFFDEDGPPFDLPEWAPEWLKHERPEVDRHDLREMMLDSIDPSAIKYDHHFSSIVPASPQASPPTYTLTFKNQPESSPFNIIIGADGAWSHVRPYLTPQAPLYTGISFIEFVISDVDNKHPKVVELVKDGLALVIGDGKALIPQRNSHGVVKVYAALKVPEDWLESNPIPTNPDDARAWVAGHFEGFCDEGMNCITSADDEGFVGRKIWAMPPGTSWTREGYEWEGVTILGDAAHVASPMAGEGVNQAMLDALDVGKAIESVHVLSQGKQTSQAISTAITNYEKKMLARTKEVMEESAANLDAMVEGGAGAFAKICESHGPPAWMMVVMVPAIYAILGIEWCRKRVWG